jgi:hypothetical protein
VKETFIGKSIRCEDGSQEADYFNPQVVEVAADLVKKMGLLRCLMFPRFLDTLLKTQWYERKLFTESLIAAEDMIPLGQVFKMSPSSRSRFVLVGNARRCRIYEQLLRSHAGSAIQVTAVSREDEIDQLSIRGVIHLAKTAGLF